MHACQSLASQDRIVSSIAPGNARVMHFEGQIRAPLLFFPRAAPSPCMSNDPSTIH
jgi:hypothetical protein